MSVVSVVVPTRDRRELLATTLHSVLWQRDVQLEVIVVDDGSVDDTARLVTDLGDARVTLIRHTVSRGQSAARNSGAQKARGDWVGFIDDDDVWAPDKLAHQIRAAERFGRNWVYVGAVNIDSHLKIVSGSVPPTPDQVVVALPRYNPIPGGGSNVILTNRILTEVGGFDERFTPCEDWELWARLMHMGPPASVPRPLVGYRLHDESMSLDTARILSAVRLIQRVHDTPIDWGRIHRWLAESCLRTDAHPEALRHFAQAAMRGQAGGVASDVIDIIRRRLARPFGREVRPAPVRGRDWSRQAASWLGELAQRVSAAGEPGHG